MSPPFVLRHALREWRSSARRLGVYMIAIALGVAALVAINSFRANVVSAVNDESRALLGADLRLSSSRPFPDSVVTLIDSLATTPAGISSITSTVSVALAPGGATRLVQLRALRGGYPYYGTFGTDPPGLWGTLDEDRRAFVEPELLAALDVTVGDTIRIGETAFYVAATLSGLPPEVSFRSALAPRVFIAERWLDETGLLRFGSLVQYQVYVRFDDENDAEAFGERYRDMLRSNQVGWDTAREQAEDLAFALDTLGRMLGVVGLAALLLGGLGVASAVNVFVKEKRATIAVLRCIGATQRTAFSAYLLQAALLGLAGGVAGALIGLAVQPLLPYVVGDLLPVDVALRPHLPSVVIGLTIGVAVATLFALLPLLAIRGITPLQALRHEVEPEPSPRDVWRIAAWAALLAAIVLLSIIQAGQLLPGLTFAGGLAATLGVLGLAAWLMTRATRRFFPRRARFVVRQGVASLFRPHNQTAAITMALGFGVFLVATLWLVQRNLLNAFELSEDQPRANLVAFDIQPDQRDDLLAVFRSAGVPEPELVPIVPARIAAINGRPVAEVQADSPRTAQPWALRREYRNTYRAHMTSTERLLQGRWWSEDAGSPPPGSPPRISLEQDVFEDLGVRLGDRITWDFQGVRIETVVASTRQVDWARFETNFFAVFEPGVLEQAPQSFVTLARVPEPEDRAAIARDVVRQHPNVSFIDLDLVQQTIARIVGRVTLAIRFMGIFSIAAGALVLVGAIAATRYQRLRESVLLRTLGASRLQVRQILFTEYFALGVLAGLAGTLLAVAAAWGLVRFFFDMSFSIPFIPLIAVGLGVVTLTTVIGLFNSRDALRRTPLAVLREAVD